MKKLLSLISITLAAAAISIAVRGQFAFDYGEWITASADNAMEQNGVGFTSLRDAIYLFRRTHCQRGLPAWNFTSEAAKESEESRPILYHHTNYPGFSEKLDGVLIKHWVLISPAIAMAILFNWKAWRRRPGPGHCQACGYDLRESPERCPECGKLVPSAEIVD